MEITKDMQVVIDYCIENNIKYKVCEYVARKGSDYKEGTIISVLYVDVDVKTAMDIQNKFIEVFKKIMLCRLSQEKDIKKMIEKGYHSLLK